MPETILPLSAEGRTPVAPGQSAGGEDGLVPADPLAAEGFAAALATELSQLAPDLAPDLAPNSVTEPLPLAPDPTVVPDAPEGLVEVLAEPPAGRDLPLTGGIFLPVSVTGVQLVRVMEPVLGPPGAQEGSETELAPPMEVALERAVVPGPPAPSPTEAGGRSVPDPLRAPVSPEEAPAIDVGRTPAGMPGSVASEATREGEPVIKIGSDSSVASAADSHSTSVRPDARPPLSVPGEPSRQPDPLVPRFELPEATQSPRWNETLGNRVAWMASNQVHQAELRLNPPALGPLEVRVQVNQDEASVVFSAQHGAVREALEAAVPRLRELMGANGLNLVHVDVSGQGLARDSGRNDWPGRDSAPGGPGMAGAPGGESLQLGTSARLRVGLVDDYA